MQKHNPRFNSMPNFRSLVKEETKTHETTKIYRSSRPDFLSYEEVEEFRKLGIRSIIDFRATSEYRKAQGSKLLDSFYEPIKIKLPLFGDVPINNVEQVRVQVPDSGSHQNHYIGKHFFIDFFKMNYVYNVFRKVSIWFRIYSLLYLLYDLLFGTGFKHFIRLFAKKVINKEGLAGQYADMLNHSKASIYAGVI